MIQLLYYTYLGDTTLEGCEFQWQSELPIADEAILYLDDLTVSHLQFLGLLPKLQKCGITAYVSANEIKEADALISYDSVSRDVLELVERLRIRLREGLRIGKLRLGKAVRNDHEGNPHDVSSHPAVDILRLNESVDAGVTDDRYISQHKIITLGPNDRPLLTTLDILDLLTDCGAISVEQRREALTKLRQAQFVLIPLKMDDLTVLIDNCSVQNGKLEETAEIKSIRENIDRVRMSNMLQLPKELDWLDRVTNACIVCLENQWMNDIDEATSFARSDWLLALIDVRKWVHRNHKNGEQLKELYLDWIMLLVLLPLQQSEKEAYWRWFDSRVIEPLQNEDLDWYKNLLEKAKERVADIVEVFCKQKQETVKETDSLKQTFVRFALNYLPPRIRNSLISDKEFVESWKLKTFANLTIDENGPTFQRDQIYNKIRKVIRDPDKEFTIEDNQKVLWRIHAIEEKENLAISLGNDQRTISLTDHLGLTDDRDTRMNWFMTETEEAGLIGEVFEDWKSRMNSRPLTNEEFSEFTTELKLTSTVNYLKMQHEFVRGQVKVATLIPSERRYYDRLVGTCRPAMDVNGYIKSEVEPLIKQLQDWNPVRGFLASLLMCSKSTVSEFIRIDGLSEEQLLRSYEWITKYGDPISQVGALEVALRHTDLVPKLEPFIEKIAEGFITDDTDDNKGCFSLLSTMIALLSSELGRMGIMKETRPFYRRQAAIAQASIVTRAIKTTNADSAEVVEWVRRKTGSGHEFFLQGWVDLRLEPRWLPSFVDPAWLREELIGRVLSSGQKCQGNIQSESLRNILTGQDSRLSMMVDRPFSNLPELLDGELTPIEGGGFK